MIIWISFTVFYNKLFSENQNKPSYSKITKKDIITHEAHTRAPTEFKLPSVARIRWKIKALNDQKYQFIIGIDLLNTLDTIIVMENHLCAIRKINKVLEENRLKVQIHKCNFIQKETSYLGHIITKDGLKPSPDKIKIIDQLELSKTLPQIKSFLGLTGYYRKFVRDYAKVVQPVIKFLRKNVTINTKAPNYIKAFTKLKILISSHPILRFPNFDKPF